MRAAPDAALAASGHRAKIAANQHATVLVAVQSSRIKVNSALTSYRTGLLLAEATAERKRSISAGLRP